MSEQSLILGSENHLVATLTPAVKTAAGPPAFAAVLTNSGVIPRAGPHRINVRLARRLAEMGIPSVRFDLSGLGDSRRSRSTLPAVLQWVADTRSVLDVAQSQFGCDRFVMVGLCSGAEVAHLTALEDPRLRAAVLWDSYSYATLQSLARTVLYRLRRAGLRGAIKKFLPAAIHALRTRGAKQNSSAESWPTPSRDEYARQIDTLVDAGTELLLAFSGGFPEQFNHRGQFRAMFRRYRFVDKVAFDYLEQCDHVITRREAQELFSNMVVNWLERRVLAPRE